MTGPDGTHSDNKARVRGPGTAYQAGQIHGDAHMGNTTRSTTISLGAFGVVVGVVMTLLVGFAVWKLVATNGGAANGAATTTPNPTSAPVSDSRAKEVRLTRGTGVDADAGELKATPGDGANGKLDLYLDRTNLAYANGSGFSDDRGTEQKAQERCTEVVTSGTNTNPSIFPSVPGTQYCFETTDGQVGWIRVKSSTLPSLDSDASAVLAVRVWPR